MKYYYYSENDQQLGPFLKEDLKQKLIKKDTLVWTDGLAEWVNAETLEDLKDIIVSLPPPLPIKTIQSKKIETVQVSTLTKTKEVKEEDTGSNSAIIIGIVSYGLYYLLYNNVVNLNYADSESYNSYYITLWIIFIFRVFATIGATRIAFSKNLNITSWGVLTFIFPGISLIILGLSKKKNLIIKIDGNLPKEEQVSLLIEKTKKLFKYNRFDECVEVLNKAHEINLKNLEVLYLRAKAYYKLNKLSFAQNDFIELLTNSNYEAESNYYLGIVNFRNNEKQLSHKYLKNAVEQKFELAEKLMDKLFTFSNKFLLDENQIIRKIGNDIKPIDLKVNYIDGFSEINELMKIYESVDTSIHYNNFGIKITVETYSYNYGIKKKISNIGLSYGEVTEFITDEQNNVFIIKLNDAQIRFSILNSNFFNDNVRLILNDFKAFNENNVDFDTN